MALLLALHLGLQMARGKKGRGNLIGRKGMTIVRTILVASLGLVLVWHLALPSTVPSTFFIHIPDELKMAGLAIFMVGMSLRIWSQKTLGDQWSADISAKVDGHVIQNGPYAFVRHPIYLSYLIIAPALFIMTANWPVGMLALLYVLVSIGRISCEEEFLIRHFGVRYLSYVEAVNNRWKTGLALLVLTVNISGIILEMLILMC